MPFRVQEFRERCAACGSEAERTCVRCNAPCCCEHFAAQYQFCGPCESGFLRHLHARDIDFDDEEERTKRGIGWCLALLPVSLLVGLAAVEFLLFGAGLAALALYGHRRLKATWARFETCLEEYTAVKDLPAAATVPTSRQRPEP